jgi:hypothetical protein
MVIMSVTNTVPAYSEITFKPWPDLVFLHVSKEYPMYDEFLLVCHI